MSKSYRKFVSFADNQRGGAKYGKRMANKVVRHFDGDIPKGYAYIKKMFCSYDIHDYRSTYYNNYELQCGLEDSKRCGWNTNSFDNKLKRSKILYQDKLFKRTSIRKSYTN